MTTPMIATCREIVDLLTEYLDGGLGAGDRLAFERHVVLCPPCRAHLGQMRQTLRVAGTIADDDLSPTLRDGLLEAFRDWRRGA